MFTGRFYFVLNNLKNMNREGKGKRDREGEEISKLKQYAADGIQMASIIL